MPTTKRTVLLFVRAERAAKRIVPSVWMDRGATLSPNSMRHIASMVAEGWWKGYRAGKRDDSKRELDEARRPMFSDHTHS
jgi:hypothetical protein